MEEVKRKSRKRQIKKSQVVIKYTVAVLALFVIIFVAIKMINAKKNTNMIVDRSFNETEYVEVLEENDVTINNDENVNIDLNKDIICYL